jgi:hypothetical protein
VGIVRVAPFTTPAVCPAPQKFEIAIGICTRASPATPAIAVVVNTIPTVLALLVRVVFEGASENLISWRVCNPPDHAQDIHCVIVNNQVG